MRVRPTPEGRPHSSVLLSQDPPMAITSWDDHFAPVLTFSQSAPACGLVEKPTFMIFFHGSSADGVSSPLPALRRRRGRREGRQTRLPVVTLR